MFTEKDDNKNEGYLMTSCSNNISFFQMRNMPCGDSMLT
jgi:hypothetical protein